MSFDPPIINRSWETKVSAMPNIPRGEKGFPHSLRLILEKLKKVTPLNTKIQIDGSNSKNTLEDLLIPIRPSGIVKKISTGWVTSEEIEYWLDTKDNLYLALILNGNIKFFSEILAFFKESPKTIKDIREYAALDYKLEWKSKSEILARLNWLKDLELVIYQDFSMTYSITELGIKFLGLSGFVKKEELEKQIDSTISENHITVSLWAEEICEISERDRDNRKTGLGYFPGSMQVAHITTLDYLFLVKQGTELNVILEYSASTFGISETSAKQYLATLIHLGFIERISKTLYKATELGNLFTKDNFGLDFACCVNKKYAFVFEILFELQKKELSTKELSIIAKVSFNFPSEDSSNISKRLHILKNANLIQEHGVSAYTLTNRGILFCERFKNYYQLNNSSKSNLDENIAVKLNEDTVKKILNELRISSRDSANPNRFEEVLSKAFILLGFKADWLGGSGKTDVLIQAPTSPKFTYKVAIDAKTTYSGGITESQINFDTIVDHRKKHKADYSLVIGREFQGERLIERAIKHNVALLDIEMLEYLIKMHIEVPLKSEAYRKIFSQKGLVDISPLESDQSKIIRDGILLQSLMRCLSEESEDSLTEGIIQPREIYLLLKHKSEIKPSPTLEEINQMLDLLSSPLIGCVGITKEGYYAIGSLSDAAQKFEFYLKACKN
jgi:predicted transcriptional regulator